MAGGEVQHQAPISGLQDELDAISHGVNVMAGELYFRVQELQKAQGHLVQTGKLAALGEVSSGLAHELNNPLAIIRGYVEMAQETLEKETLEPMDRTDLLRYFERIDSHVDRMSSIICHIMEFSRQTQLRLKPVQISEVIRKSFILLNEQLRLKNIQVEREFGGEDFWVWGDELRLEQVLINLFTNSRDAIVAARREDGGMIRIQVAAESESILKLTVSDNGTGIEEAIMGDIFNPFFTTKAVGAGTGLGLSISLGIIQEQGGSISCRSEPGKGAQFEVRLPRWIGIQNSEAPL